MPTYHPDSMYGKVEKLLYSNLCFCGAIKRIGKPCCMSCWEDIQDKASPLVNTIIYGKGEDRLDAIDAAIEELGYKL